MKWALLAFGVVVWPCQCTNAGAPEVCGASLTAEGATLVYGANFQAERLAVHVEGATRKGTEGNEGELREGLRRVLRGEAGLPKAPDASAKTWKKVEHFEENILLCDAGGEASSRPAEVKVLFVKNAHGVSPPLVMNRPEIWGVSARQPSPGEDLFVWGVNLGAKFALASPSGEVLILCGYQAYNPHSHRPEGRFMKGMVIPDGLKPGRHRLFNWGGHGDAGWSEAFDLEIVERPNAPTAMLKLADFGAVGDGLTDDTAAFLKAFEAAQAAGGGRIHVPPGRYVLSQSLLMPEGVGLFGVSRELTTLLASPSKQLGYPKPRRGLEVLMIQLASNCTLSDLTLDVTGAPTPTQNAVMIHIPGGDRVTLNRLALVDKKGGPYGEYPDFRVWSGVVVTGSTQDLVVERCLFSTSGVPFSCWPSHNVGGRIRYNTFTTSDPHLAFELFMPRTLDSCLIEGNKFVNGGRAKTE
ncbi:MAG: hypothetical protein FJ278_18615 [Planctomycetes bacterium]|nr:hypothetical protein [Planctomycetota bacterium]